MRACETQILRERRRRRLLRLNLGLTVVLLGVLGCANMKAPTGGPLDKDSPRIESSVPDSGFVGVARIDSLVFTFSEPMNRQSVEDEFQMTPPVRFRAKEWRELTWILRLEAPLDTSTTYVAHFGRNTKDRRDNTLETSVSIPFSTGDVLDAGSVEGKVIGSRFRAQGLEVYAWPWADGAPDTTDSYYPPTPIRLGETSAEGEFRIAHLPAELPLRLCAFFDRDGDGRFQPFPDRWACTEEPIVLTDSTMTQSAVEIFLVEDEEPGTLAGTVADSSCLSRDPRATLRAVRAERDSLLEWLLGEWDARERGRGTMTSRDSVRIESQLSTLDSREIEAGQDSALCARPIRVELTAADSVVSEVAGPDYKFTEVLPGIYRLRAFRDLDEDGEVDDGEPTGAFPYAVEVAPLREIDDLTIELGRTLRVSRPGPDVQADPTDPDSPEIIGDPTGPGSRETIGDPTDPDSREAIGDPTDPGSPETIGDAADSDSLGVSAAPPAEDSP